jgi:acetate---CoA ligase (ADP-forming)
MIVKELMNPASIAVVGASNNVEKPGGKVLYNLLSGDNTPPIYPVNPREREVQTLQAFRAVADLPPVELAILAIPATACVDAVRILAREKGTRGFIVLSAGFGEESQAGAALEEELAGIVDQVDGSLLGPNCIGMITPRYNGVFTTPIPPLDPRGCDLISGSGATAVFIMEAGIPKGLTFSRVFSVGNSTQIGVEEVLEYLDATCESGGVPGAPGASGAPSASGASDDSAAAGNTNPKLLYIESIRNPEKFLRHARSLVNKGCPIAAVKAGSSAAGSRAAGSHTGALAGSDAAVDALFRKAGVVRCYSREELTTVGAVFAYRPLRGDRIAVVTHAGGPAVMLTDTLSHGGLQVPSLEGPATNRLRTELYPGSSTANPIDFLATGTADQLATILDFCEHECAEIDGTVVIFGSPGLVPVDDAYRVLHEKIRSGKKPVYPVLPSVVNADREIAEFGARGNVSFPDEVALGRALARIRRTEPPAEGASRATETRRIQDAPPAATTPDNTCLPPEQVQELLDDAGIPRVTERVVNTVDAALGAAHELGYPVVMKVVGPIHKSDIGGVVIDVRQSEQVRREFDRITNLAGATAVMIQPMVSGQELYAGVSAEDRFGHLIVAGLGGVFVEILRDVQYGLVPVERNEALTMIRALRGYRLITGVRGQAGAGEERFAEILVRLSRLVENVPEIREMDLNPLIATEEGIFAVDARILTYR